MNGETKEEVIFDYDLQQFRNTRTGRFMGLEKGITRINVGGGTLFLLDDVVLPPPPTEADIEKWGEFA